ncbi:MAG: L-lactate dehydrogenase [Clostridia bacterium]|jgi:L-lactate dehydrogenase|nr:L-lactate dehydrogenase [Clostridia bacterium]
MKKFRVVIIGIGHVGSHCALALITRGIADEIIIIDINEEKAVSQTLDLGDAAIFAPRPVTVRTGGYAHCREADIVVVCVGSPPDLNRSRMDYLLETKDMVKSITGPLKDSGFSGILINISNPADVVTYYLQTRTGFPAERVISTSNMLDSARLTRILSEKTGVAPQEIEAFSMGEHGASLMVPWSQLRIKGKPLLEQIEEGALTGLDLAEIKELTKRAGYDVIRGKGSTEFGIGAALAELVQCILRDERKTLPVAVYLDGEYGQREVYAAVPTVVGRDGVAEIKEIPLTKEELQEFAASCTAIRQVYRQMLEDN